MNKAEKQRVIAKRITKELKSGELVNLGIGLPTLVANHLPADVKILLQSENGFVGLGPTVPGLTYRDPAHIVNSGGQPSDVIEGASFFDSSMSFGLIRGGHVDVTVLGALQVDAHGNIASHLIPNKMMPGMGGAMDLLVGSKKVIIAMEHTAGENKKILAKCTLPLTGVGVVDLIVTEMGVFEVTPAGLVLKEVNPVFTLDDIKAATEAELIIPDHLT